MRKNEEGKRGMLEKKTQVKYLVPRPPPLGDMSLEESVAIGLAAELTSERPEFLMKLLFS